MHVDLRLAGGLLVVLALACSESATPSPSAAAGSLAPAVAPGELKDPFRAHEVRPPAPAPAPAHGLKDPFAQGGAATGESPEVASDLKDPFAHDPAAPATTPTPTGEPSSSGLKNPFDRKGAAAPATGDGELQNPFAGDARAKASDPPLKDPFAKK